MRHRTRLPIIPILLVVVLLIAVAAWSAPIVASTPKLSGDQRSLAGLEKIQLVFHTDFHTDKLADYFTNSTFTMDDIREQWRDRLEQAGFELANGSDAATLLVWARSLKDENVPEAWGFAVFCELIQPVHLERLEQTVTLSTYRGISVGLEHKRSAQRVFKGELDFLLDSFIKAAHMATKYGN